MRKKNVISYKNWCMKKLKEIQNEICNNNYNEELQELYLVEQYYEGQIKACTYILNNC